jgi:4-amino-4-deoxy-L-arabinose transferase-like glycosyltransferase
LSVFFWAWAVNLFWTALESRKTGHWAGLGLIIGLGFLAKFTNGLQLGCIALFLLWSKPHRSLFFSRQTVAMCAAFLLSIAPILYWNVQTGWIHAMALRSRSGVKESFGIHPAEFLQFVGGEMAVISPRWRSAWSSPRWGF